MIKSPSVGIRCDKCRIVRRRKKGKTKNTKKPRIFVICENPRHKQSQG